MGLKYRHLADPDISPPEKPRKRKTKAAQKSTETPDRSDSLEPTSHYANIKIQRAAAWGRENLTEEYIPF